MVVPSISPIHRNNPAFQIMDVDSKTLEIRDLRTYALNLGSPSGWSAEADFDRDFRQSGVSASSIEAVLRDMRDDAGERARLASSFVTGSDYSAPEAKDFQAYACSVTSSDAGSFKSCYCKGGL